MNQCQETVKPAAMPEYQVPNGQEYVAVRAEENGVVIFGLTRGKDTRLSHTEKLDQGEVMLLQFTQHISAVKVRGKARIYTKLGMIESGNYPGSEKD